MVDALAKLFGESGSNVDVMADTALPKTDPSITALFTVATSVIGAEAPFAAN